MKTGALNLFCPICGEFFRYDQSKPGDYWHHRKFGVIKTKKCFLLAEKKYAMMILGKDDI